MSSVIRLTGKSALVAAGMLLVLAPLAGCGHTHTATDAPPASPADKRSVKQSKRDDSGARATHHPGPIKSDSRAGAPFLATSPSGLLKPEAVESLQKRLVSSGHLSKDDQSGKLDEPTHKALREFQRQNNMPATGMPDDLTVQKLGLKPEQLFLAAPKSGDAH